MRIVIKVGTKVLTDDNGVISRKALRLIVEQIVESKEAGHEVILVSSGAMGAGKSLLKNDKKLLDIGEKQFFAAVGQTYLMSEYMKLFAHYTLHCAQVLATKEDFRDRLHFLNMRNCFEALLHDNVVPIVNENDVVTVRELTFTDNDELAGLVASMLSADKLIILSSVDGLMDMNQGKRISRVARDEYGMYEKLVTTDISSVGRGGMTTKFAIARRLTAQGITVHLANGLSPTVVRDILNGEDVGTQFVSGKKLSTVKRRLAHADMEVKGDVYINECAVDILKGKDKANSLLFVGITQVTGSFEKGDILRIISPEGIVLGYGVSRYNKVSIMDKLGEKGTKPLIHYDNMFIE